MDEITKRRKTRTVLSLRASVTKHINKLEQGFDELDTEAKLQQHLDFLTNMLKQINDLDSQIQALITNEKIFDAEIESAIEYSQKISMWNSKLSAQIKSYRNTTEKNLKFHQALLTQETLNRSVENINEFESSNSNVRERELTII
ncbi:hypothetical protein TNIN_89831 [Trichonephila inaurata madagascariensis]|uniref:Uncharacterized protein n=1 Tax=Trichonephila inaurata madagascariensis TaxID=2747483 RepID=A0A8X6XL35_9ARAC|nr:hypothetical protein TNIN_490721 [Trichonephila inaurata madagascariensis]GFY55146.1 hypothetical protein TNIN_89831 [Trichonephila inaurata madagascariensis]